MKYVGTIINIMANLPLSLLYIISDYMLYPFIRHVVRYRRDVVEKNLALSFPGKSDKERLSIEKTFYHNMCDILVETIRLRKMHKEDLERRFVWKDSENITANDGTLKINMCYIAHYSNWEWAFSSLMSTSHSTSMYIYQPLRNSYADKWIYQNRSKFGAIPVDMHSVAKTLEALPQKDMTYTIIACVDQRPKEQYVKHFHRFMGIKTKVITGTEQLITRFGMNVYYCKIIRTKRGMYECIPQRITAEDINNSKSEWPYTDSYFDHLQEQILLDPGQWLWSHDRWKS